MPQPKFVLAERDRGAPSRIPTAGLAATDLAAAVVARAVLPRAATPDLILADPREPAADAVTPADAALKWRRPAGRKGPG